MESIRNFLAGIVMEVREISVVNEQKRYSIYVQIQYL